MDSKVIRMRRNKSNGMNKLKRFGWSLVLASTLSAADGAQPAAAAKAMEKSVARQRDAVASMAGSLEAQRRSVQGQLAGMPVRSVFQRPSWRPFANLEPSCPPLGTAELEPLVDQAAEQENLDPDLLRSVIRQESAARPCAVSSKGAMGLMQLMPATAMQLGVTDAFDPKQNVNAGARLLKQLLQSYGGDLPMALGAFNAGPGRVNQAGGVPDYPETLDYVQKVLAFLPLTQ
jgi:soluble lytic murein transglycosylase-like protein